MISSHHTTVYSMQWWEVKCSLVQYLFSGIGYSAVHHGASWCSPIHCTTVWFTGTVQCSGTVGGVLFVQCITFGFWEDGEWLSQLWLAAYVSNPPLLPRQIRPSRENSAQGNPPLMTQGQKNSPLWFLSRRLILSRFRLVARGLGWLVATLDVTLLLCCCCPTPPHLGKTGPHQVCSDLSSSSSSSSHSSSSSWRPGQVRAGRTLWARGGGGKGGGRGGGGGGGALHCLLSRGEEVRRGDSGCGPQPYQRWCVQCSEGESEGGGASQERMTRNGHGPPGGVAVMAAAGKEKGAKVVYGDGSWQLTIFVTDLQVNASVEPMNPEWRRLMHVFWS